MKTNEFIYWINKSEHWIAVDDGQNNIDIIRLTIGQNRNLKAATVSKTERNVFDIDSFSWHLTDELRSMVQVYAATPVEQRGDDNQTVPQVTSDKDIPVPDNDCPYCSWPERHPLAYYLSGNNVIELSLSLTENEFKLGGDAIRYRKIGNDIKYCPMCGRRLGEW